MAVDTDIAFSRAIANIATAEERKALPDDEVRSYGVLRGRRLWLVTDDSPLLVKIIDLLLRWCRQLNSELTAIQELIDRSVQQLQRSQHTQAIYEILLPHVTVDDGELRTLRGRLEELEAELQTAQDTICEEQQTAKAAQAHLQGRLDTMADTLAEYSKTMDEVICQRDTSLKALALLQAEYDNAVDQQSQALQTLQEQSDRQIESSKKSLEDALERNKQLFTQLWTLQQQQKTDLSQLEDTHRQAEDLKTQLQQATQQLKDKDRDLRTAIGQKATLQQQLDQQKDLSGRDAEEVKRLGILLSQQTAQLRSQQVTFEEAKKNSADALAQALAAADKLREQVTEYSRENSRLTQRCTRQEGLEQQLQNQQSCVTALEQQLGVLKERCTALEADNNDLSSQLSSVDQELRDLKQLITAKLGGLDDLYDDDIRFLRTTKLKSIALDTFLDNLQNELQNALTFIETGKPQLQPDADTDTAST